MSPHLVLIFTQYDVIRTGLIYRIKNEADSDSKTSASARLLQAVKMKDKANVAVTKPATAHPKPSTLTSTPPSNSSLIYGPLSSDSSGSNNNSTSDKQLLTAVSTNMPILTSTPALTNLAAKVTSTNSKDSAVEKLNPHSTSISSVMIPPSLNQQAFIAVLPSVPTTSSSPALPNLASKPITTIPKTVESVVVETGFTTDSGNGKKMDTQNSSGTMPADEDNNNGVDSDEDEDRLIILEPGEVVGNGKCSSDSHDDGNMNTEISAEVINNNAAKLFIRSLPASV